MVWLLRTQKAWVGRAGTILLGVAFAFGLTAGSSSAEGKTLPTCSSSHLAVIALPHGVGMGSATALVTMHNTSSVPCGLTGYPHLKLLLSPGDPLPTRDQHLPGEFNFASSPRVTQVRLKPGERHPSP